MRLMPLMFVLAALCTSRAAHCSPDKGPAASTLKLDKQVISIPQMASYVSAIVRVPNTSEKVAVLDSCAVQILDLATFAPGERIQFGECCQSPIFAPTDGQTNPSFMCRGGGFGDLLFFDPSGKPLWRRSKVLRAAVCDLNRDEASEVYMATWKGIERLSLDGQTVWTAGQGKSYGSVLCYDGTFEGAKVIIAFTQNSEFELINYDGVVVRPRSTLGTNLVVGDIVEWPGPLGGPVIVTWKGDRDRILRAYAITGALIFEHDFSGVPSDCFHLEAEIVRFRDDGDHYLAALIKFGGATGKSMFCVFSLDGSLVYQDVLGRSKGLLVVDTAVLVGDGVNRIVKYELAKQPP